MRSKRFPRWTLVCGLLCLAATANAQVDAHKSWEQQLKSASFDTTDAGLLELFQKRALNVEPEKVRQMVRELGSRKYEVRQRANRSLRELGIGSVPALLEAENSKDLEVRHRVQRTLERIRRNDKPELIRAAAQLLAHRKLNGAAKALVECMPTVSDAETIRIMHESVTAVAKRDGKLDPDLIAALDSKRPAIRAGAAVALCRIDAKEHFAKIEKQLQSTSAHERLHVGTALARTGNHQAVPVLIRLLTEIPASQIWEIEDILYALAVENAPTLAFGEKNEDQRAFRDAWLTWWRNHGDKVVLKDRLKKPGWLNYTTIVLLDEGRIVDLDDKKKTRFAVENVNFPLDVEMLPGERLLIAEHGGNCVTMRHRKGNVLWKVDVDEPLVAQRLPNGHVFIAGKQRLFEVDRAGKEVFSYTRPNQRETFMRARKLQNGDLACVTLYQTYVRLSPEGKQLESMSVNVNTSGGRVDVLENGNVLIPEMNYNRVTEYDPRRRRAVNSYSISEPIVATALPNGNVLATSMDEKAAVEVTPKGKEVWRYEWKTRVSRAVRR